ncbi:MAG: hypothetical protein WA705_19965 [Candidatus Ozemobacteraceae bacterium]
MWRNTTMKGLDDALSELNRAIEALPDSGTKKGLITRFGKLHRVRRELEQPRPGSSNLFPAILGGAAMLLAIVSLYVYFVFIRRTSCVS